MTRRAASGWRLDEPSASLSRTTVFAVILAYAAATVAITWPLALRATTAIGGDDGDALFVAWVMAWSGDHLAAVLRGDGGAWAAMWQAPTFAPAPDALTFSEHFLAQSAQALPLRWFSDSPLFAYNVLFVATVLLTGVAAHLLTWELTGSHLAGAIAGLTCTFNDYRFYWSVVHLQTLSIHWWIFGLWGLDRFVASGSRGALAGATASLVALNLSSSYLLAYCAPFTAAFCLWSLSRHRRLRDRSAWLGVLAAGAVSVASVLPLLRRYLATSDALQVSRTLGEMNSASLESIGQAWPWFGPLLGLAILGALIPSASPRMPSRPARWALVALAAAAIVLSFGPVTTIGGTTVWGPYALLRDAVPGFGGLRVPHRFVAIATVFMATLAGTGGAWLTRSRLGLIAVVVAVALTTRTAWSRPFPIDVPLMTTPLAPVPAYLLPSNRLPPIYRLVAATPPGTTVVELPFGSIAYEIRYTFFTRSHGRRILNGYAGVLPPAYLARQAALRTPWSNADAAWAALAPATHVVVHTAAWPDDTGGQVRGWLEQHGARVFASADGAWLYELPPR